MDKKQALERLDALENEASQLRKIIEAPEKITKRWKPEDGERYWFLSGIGEIHYSIWVDDYIDNYRYKNRNYFKTKEEAQEELERINFVADVQDRLDELNGDWEADFDNCYEQKWVMYWYKDELRVNSTSVTRNIPINKHGKSEEVLETILKEFDNEKLKKWWI